MTYITAEGTNAPRRICPVGGVADPPLKTDASPNPINSPIDVASHKKRKNIAK
jgi:hypothetical protein